MNQDLIKAYLNTTYRVFYNHSYFDINNYNMEVENFIISNKANNSIFLTAYNPNSFLLSDSENKQLQENLIEEIKRLNYTFYYAEGIPNNTDWKSEPSLFILNITEETTNYLMDKYNQNAVVRVQAENKIVELFFNSKLSIKNLRLNIVNF